MALQAVETMGTNLFTAILLLLLKRTCYKLLTPNTCCQQFVQVNLIALVITNLVQVAQTTHSLPVCKLTSCNNLDVNKVVQHDKCSDCNKLVKPTTYLQDLIILCISSELCCFECDAHFKDAEKGTLEEVPR